ncbi:MAG: hypothetical protein LBO06_03465 [Bacteroidales bacterium]|jgi:hypothetical protein|nr:hypothetical protein [Bacteroidales bacterium]
MLSRDRKLKQNVGAGFACPTSVRPNNNDRINHNGQADPAPTMVNNNNKILLSRDRKLKQRDRKMKQSSKNRFHKIYVPLQTQILIFRIL